MTEKEASLKELQTIPGVGKSISGDLWALGIKHVSALKNVDPELLFARSNALAGISQDPCLLYTFRCAVYFATEPKPEAEKLKWWYWKDKK